MDAGTRGRGLAEKGELVQEATGVVIIEEILFYESKGLSGARALGDSGKRGTLFGFALSIFGEPRAGVQTKAGPVEDGCGATEKRLAIVHGCGGDTFVQEIEDGESERLFLFLWFAPGALGGDQVREEWM
jgi:hypothetical protein